MPEIPVELISGALIVGGILGLIVPVLPGLLMTLGGVLLWAAHEGTTTAWVVFALCAVTAATGWVLQWTRPNRHLRAAGVPGRAKLFGVVLGAVGFFVVPVVGLLLGFVLGVYLAEQARLRNAAAAWASTKAALRAAAMSVLIELFAAVVVALVWVVGLCLT